MDTSIVERFEGTYRLRDFPEERFDVKAGAGGRLTWSRQGKVHRELVAAGEDRLLSPDSGMTLQVVGTGSLPSRAQVLELRFGGGINIAERVP